MQSLKKRYNKRKQKLAANAVILKNVLRGDYTGKKILLSWKGKPSRFDLINSLIKSQGYKTYLEIGCRSDACFSQVTVEHKVGVDPASGGTHRMTSDAFFAQNKETFDIIFIDGLHLYEQVIKDINNSVRFLNDGGTIVMHDCLPLECFAQYESPVVRAWNGDTWKAFVEARTMGHIDSAVCLIDHGVGIIKKRKNANPLTVATKNFKRLKYSFLAKDYARILNTLEYDEALRFATRT